MATDRPTLIVLAGLPGTGKTTLARLLARSLEAVHLRIDSIETELFRAPHLRFDDLEDVGYRVAYAIAEDNLKLGRTVVADSVNPVELTRRDWLAVGERAGCPSVEVEIVCSDTVEHRARIEARVPDIPGATRTTWDAVVARETEAFGRDRIVVDTAGRTAVAAADELLGRLTPYLAEA